MSIAPVFPRLIATALAFCLAATPAFATSQTASPASPPIGSASDPSGSASALVAQVSHDTMTAIERDKTHLQADQAALNTLIRNHVAVVFDATTAARRVAGPLGRTASAQDIGALGVGVTAKLVEQYGWIIQKLDFTQPVQIRGEADLPNNRGVRVDCAYVHLGGNLVKTSYFLARDADGAWKFYDVEIEGISFDDTLRTQLQDALHHLPMAYVGQQMLTKKVNAIR